jgi:hypothetical protein
MSDILSVESIGNVILYLAPGYIAVGVYRSVFEKKELGDTPMLITSAVYSLPIVALANEIVVHITGHWQHLPFKLISKPDNLAYVILLIVLSPIAGYLAVMIRRWKPVKKLLDKLDFSPPEPDLYLRVMKVDHEYCNSSRWTYFWGYSN